MKEPLSTHKTGLILGGFFGFMHLCWGFLVALGLAQPLMDFIYSIHFMNNPFIISGFSIITLLLLVIVTGVIGYIFGYVFAYIWNLIHKK